MRVYLDVSCLNRPLDDQSQPRIRREAEAVIAILEQIAAHSLECAFSEIGAVEIGANRDPERRRRVRAFLPDNVDQRMLNDAVLARARVLRAAGMASADALHVAFAEDAAVDVFLTCDDKVCRFARRNPQLLNVLVENPANWIEERTDDTDS
jgi:predicted nucleic acid-binding protein